MRRRPAYQQTLCVYSTRTCDRRWCVVATSYAPAPLPGPGPRPLSLCPQTPDAHGPTGRQPPVPHRHSYLRPQVVCRHRLERAPSWQHIESYPNQHILYMFSARTCDRRWCAAATSNAPPPGTTPPSSMVFFTARRPSRSASLICVHAGACKHGWVSRRVGNQEGCCAAIRMWCWMGELMNARNATRLIQR